MFKVKSILRSYFIHLELLLCWVRLTMWAAEGTNSSHLFNNIYSNIPLSWSSIFFSASLSFPIIYLSLLISHKLLPSVWFMFICWTTCGKVHTCTDPGNCTYVFRAHWNSTNINLPVFVNKHLVPGGGFLRERRIALHISVENEGIPWKTSLALQNYLHVLVA